VAQDPELIRRDIEETRQHMGDTVDALAYKADVPGRTKDKITGAVDTVRERIGGVAGTVSDATPDGQQMTEGAKRAVGAAQNNPLGLAIGFAAAGFLAGLVAPSTRVENEKLGPMADQVKEQVRETGQEALERGKQVAQEAASTASEQAQQAVQQVKETAQESAQQQGEELKQSAQQSAEQVASSAPGKPGSGSGRSSRPSGGSSL
jgi:gas vesicle protein/phage tail protein X